VSLIDVWIVVGRLALSRWVVGIAWCVEKHLFTLQGWGVQSPDRTMYTSLMSLSSSIISCAIHIRMLSISVMEKES
jgi:hypothetical protein